jgi:hypothetical protein
MEQHLWDDEHEDAHDDYYNQFKLTFYRYGIEVNFVRSSAFDNNGHLDLEEEGARIVTEGFLDLVECDECRETSRALFQWILGPVSDEALADWSCEQYHKYYKGGGYTIVKKSPRVCALEILTRCYLCTNCINVGMAAAIDSV